MSLDAQRFVYNGQPVYNRFNLMSDFTNEIREKFGFSEEAFDIVLETVRMLERLGIVETVEGPVSRLLVVQNWEKLL